MYGPLIITRMRREEGESERTRRTCKVARVYKFAREKFFTAFSPFASFFPLLRFQGIFDKQGSRGKRIVNATLLAAMRQEHVRGRSRGGRQFFSRGDSLACYVRGCVRGNGSRRGSSRDITRLADTASIALR